MLSNYNPKRERNCFDPASCEPYKLSRTKLENFVRCPRCFYFDRRLGIAYPPSFPYTLNSAVDKLLKREFDIHRSQGTPHPMMSSHKIGAIPWPHEKLEDWRNNFKGIQFHHEATNFLVYGAIDDVWINPKGELHIVDYKSTAKDGEVTMEDEWKDGYKRQAEIYQWLFRKNGFSVSNTAYFVYCNADVNSECFDGALKFCINVLPYEGDDGWVEDAILNAHKCLMCEAPPEMNEECDYCLYVNEARQFL